MANESSNSDYCVRQVPLIVVGEGLRWKYTVPKQKNIIIHHARIIKLYNHIFIKGKDFYEQFHSDDSQVFWLISVYQKYIEYRIVLGS